MVAASNAMFSRMSFSCEGFMTPQSHTSLFRERQGNSFELMECHATACKTLGLLRSQLIMNPESNVGPWGGLTVSDYENISVDGCFELEAAGPIGSLPTGAIVVAGRLDPRARRPPCRP